MTETMETMAFVLMMPIIEIVVMEKATPDKCSPIYFPVLFLCIGVAKKRNTDAMVIKAIVSVGNIFFPGFVLFFEENLRGILPEFVIKQDFHKTIITFFYCERMKENEK